MTRETIWIIYTEDSHVRMYSHGSAADIVSGIPPTYTENRLFKH